MRNERPGKARSPITWLLANGIVLVVILVGLARLEGSSPGPLVLRDDAVLEELGPGWWETRRSIYHEIPARVLYRLPEGDGDRALALAEGVWDEFERIGTIFNSFDPESEVGKLNHPSLAGRHSVPVSSDLLEVLLLSRRLWQSSEGRFDPTVWPLKELWHEAVRLDRLPTEEQLAEALAETGFGKLAAPAARESTVDLPRVGLRFDFGGVAKGYAIDCVEERLRSAGVEDALVQLGGEVSAFGENDGKPWRVGVQHPRDMGAMWGVITNSGAIRVSTSGNYRQPLEIGGVTYYHIFDPRDGRPVSTRVLGITTADLEGRASTALLDGAATAIAVMGGEGGLAFARSLGIEVLILVADEDGKIQELMTDQLRSRFKSSVRGG